ncbi:MAG: 50S ribosomal protein L10 [Thermodesulfobacteriota bacterium]|nr:50S ribosomal protein L10 [Thermodesulfobacteriota bacterium]
MNRSAKEQVVTELHEKLKNVKLAILADYSGITVKDITDLRNELRKADSEFKVVKNNLLSIALRDTEFSPLDDHLKGPRALMMNFGDVVEPTRILVEFAKKNDRLEIEAGVLDGRLLSREQISALAELPSRDILLGKFLSVLVGVQTQFVTVLNGVPRGLVQVLEAHRMKKEEN